MEEEERDEEELEPFVPKPLQRTQIFPQNVVAST